MGFSLSLPVAGQSFSSEGVKVSNDLATIAQWGNGHILGTDLDPAAGITLAQLDVSAQPAVGIVQQFAGKTVPTGYALCDGRTLNRSDYPRGFDFATSEVAAGNPLWTVQPGPATYTVPNLQNLFVYSGALASIGTKAGEATHVLSAAEMPSHSHPPGGAGLSFLEPVGAGPTATLGTPGTFGVVGPASTGLTGGGGAHNNMPPYVVLALIVKV
jgi:microcystin-dependent protein